MELVLVGVTAVVMATGVVVLGRRFAPRHGEAESARATARAEADRGHLQATLVATKHGHY